MNPELVATLDRLLANVKPDAREPTFLCRCGSFYKQGREWPVGWVEISTEGRGTWRPCEQCRRVSVPAARPETSFR